MKELKGWMRPHELDPRDGRKPFDPVVEGSRYGLSQELALAIWKRVCAEATDPSGQPDLEQAKRRFHAIAARIATRGGRWPSSDVGKRTQVETERDGSSSRGASGSSRGAGMDELASRVPGQQTLVEASRGEPAGAAAMADAPGRRTLVEAEASRGEPTATAAIDQVIAAPTDETRERIGTTAPSAPERGVAPDSDEHRLPMPTLDRMERAFGRSFDDIEIHVDSGEVPTGIEAFTRGRHIYFGRGAFAPESAHGEHVIAHELAHVAQQSAPTAGAAFPTRAALEADAHQAALSALAGRAASVSLFAPAAAALGFSDGNAQHAPSSGGSGGSSRRTPGAPGRSSGGSARAPASGGSAIPRPKPAPSAKAKAPARPASAPAGSIPVSAPPRRGPTGDRLHIPEAPGALTPAAAGRLGTVEAGNQGNAAATTALPTGQQQTDVGRAAVEEPQAEQDAHAQHGVVTDVDNRPPPSPEIEEACARIRQVIRDKRPPDEDKLVEAKPREMAQEAGQQMSDGVEQRAGTVRQGYSDMQQPPPGSPSSAPVPPTLPPQHGETQPVDAGTAAPDPVNSEDVSLDADVADQKKQIEDAGMNTEPGKLVQDGPIGDARGGADELSEMAKTDPAKVIADQAKAIATAKDDMRALQQAADKALADARAGTVDQMGKHTTGVKGSEEQQRAQAGEKMKGIFDRTQKSVDGLLQPLAGKAVARWDTGVAQLSTDFEASLADVKRRIDERHSGFGGGLVKAWDKMTGLPDWATEGYDRAEAKFGDGATNLIRDISRDVNAVIEDCKGLIQQARKDIDAVVKSLPASLQTWAQGEAAKLNQQLDALDKRVDQAQKGINKDLINRANTAVQEVREKVHELREAAKGMLAKIAAAIAEFAKNPFKAIVNGLLRILGIPPDSFWGMVDRLGDVVGAIAKDPVKFGKTLISGAGQGFKQFFEHFPTHLKEILMGWLFGTMGTAGVPMPTDFSGPGIMPTVLGIIGIDSSTIMSMLGADGSDPAEMAEIHQELSGVLSGDPHALVALFRDHFDPASLVPMIREAAMSFLLQALIMQVAPRIAAMLVPGGAILTAVEAIFKVLMWVVTNAARIFTLIESLVATAGQAVAGNVSGVAAGVESGLVQIIVLVIDFLAGYIGLGGIGAKLKGVIMKVSGKLKDVLKKVLDAIKKRAKAKAKAKHPDPHKPADKKPDGDHAGPTHPKPDDRDPQKAKDDAKDPRNHQHNPDDDKDPRNHKTDPDDKDPRTHKPHDDHDPKKHKDGDDHDPKKHKPDDDDPKKKHENDLAEARRAARAAANRGWTAARNATEREVVSKAELERVLSRAEHSTPKVHISLEVQDKGISWGVEAEARVGSARARDTEGNGWIARGAGNAPWYAARNLTEFNRKLIEEAFRTLREPASEGGASEKSVDAHELYERKVQQGKQVVARMQQRLDGELRGLKASIEMEPWSRVENDQLIRTELAIQPNKTDGERQIPVNADGEEFKPITRVADMYKGKQTVAVNPERQDEGRLELTIDNRPALEQIFAVTDGPVLKAQDQTGLDFATDAYTAVEECDEQIRKISVSNGKVSKENNAIANQAAKKAAVAIGKLGQRLISRSLEGACTIRDANPVTVTFSTYRGLPEHDQKYADEMTRQLQQQQDGLNKLLLDKWVINREVYSPSEHLNKLHATAKKHILEELQRRAGEAKTTAEKEEKRLAAKKQTLEDDLEALELAERTAQRDPAAAQAELDKVEKKLAAAQQQITNYDVAIDHTGVALQDDNPEVNVGDVRHAGVRLGEEDQFKSKTKRAKARIMKLINEDPEFEAWRGIVTELKELVALHDPDQIAGGDGHIASELPRPPREKASAAAWKEYIGKVKKHYGIGVINSSIGSQWSPTTSENNRGLAQGLYDKVIKDHTNPKAVYGLNRLNVTLRHAATGAGVI